jgi:hypothetical protein
MPLVGNDADARALYVLPVCQLLGQRRAPGAAQLTVLRGAPWTVLLDVGELQLGGLGESGSTADRERVIDVRGGPSPVRLLN